MDIYEVIYIDRLNEKIAIENQIKTAQNRKGR